MKKKQISIKSHYIVLAIMTIAAIAYTIFGIYYHHTNKELIQLIFMALVLAFSIYSNNKFETREDMKKIQIRKRIYYSFFAIIVITFIAFAIFTVTSLHENKELIGSISMSLLLVFLFFFNVIFGIKK